MHATRGAWSIVAPIVRAAGVLPGGSFVAVLGGVAATVPVPADCELPPVTLALALAFATHPATPELALALALALTL